MLRALTQTCHLLRAIALPRLWALVQVHSVEELGRLRETLRASPEIAQHIRSFSFVWGMGGSFNFEGFPTDAGTTLDLAFRDRWKLWNDLRRQHRRRVQWNAHYEQWEFMHADVRYAAPGQLPAPRSHKVTKQDWQYACAQRVGGCGPDDNGEDRLIKNATQFNDCVNEIVTQLSSLEAFGWFSFVAQVPQAALNALRSLRLRSLGYGHVCRGRECLHARQ